MNDNFDFEYVDLNGSKKRAFFKTLKTIAEGPIDLDNGVIGKRVNFSPENNAYIEFRVGVEKVPGFQQYISVEVTEAYVREHYHISQRSG